MDPSDVSRWRTTGDVGRLIETLADDRVAPWVGGDAALSLITLGQGNVLVGHLATLPEPRQAVVLAYLLFSAIPAGLRTSSAQEALAIRDGLMDLRPRASESNLAQLDRLLIEQLVEDLNAEAARAGRYSNLNIARVVGAPAVTALLPMLSSPPPVLDRVADLLGQLGSVSGRDRIGRALAERAALVQSNPAALWQALGRIGGPHAATFLGRIVERGALPDAPFAAHCLRLGPGDPGLVPLALRLVAERRTDEAVREELFQLLSQIATPEARVGLLRLAGRARTAEFRRRALRAADEMAVAATDRGRPGVGRGETPRRGQMTRARSRS
jgi:hypothetical protein